MIDLNKKYQTLQGDPVVLYDIVGNKVFGRWCDDDGEWYSCRWLVETGRLYPETISSADLVEVPDFSIISFNCEKIITYFGAKVLVPYWAKWIATDLDGKVVAFQNKPWLNLQTHWCCNSGRRVVLTESATYKGDWENSLMEIK